MKKPAFVIAATKSGAGKTTLTLGVLAALVERGYNVQSFKCGPDFIDPTLHGSVTGNVSYNLDIKMMGETCCRQTFQEQGRVADILVVEGVMGLFDGGISSTAEVAKLLGLPVILVIDAQSSAESAVAVLHGFETFDRDLVIGGAIFNKLGSARHRELIENTVMARNCAEVLGYMLRDSDFVIPERHLGLHMGDEAPLAATALAKLAGHTEKYLDIDRLLQFQARLETNSRAGRSHPVSRSKKKLGFARDEAFCFYYEQNIEMLEMAGFEILQFSPLHDKTPPPGLDMLYFCGGYPENYASILAENTSMCQAVQAYHARQVPIYAECGGFMYLCRSLVDLQGDTYPMVGIFPLHTRMNQRLMRLGYRQVTLREDCLLGKAGDLLHGHEFHYSELVEQPENRDEDGTMKCLYTLDNNSYEGYSVGTTIGSYVHLHFGRSPLSLHHMANQLNP
jgi:cobyrinic acid a,c-diamide synthase